MKLRISICYFDLYISNYKKKIHALREGMFYLEEEEGIFHFFLILISVFLFVLTLSLLFASTAKLLWNDFNILFALKFKIK